MVSALQIPKSRPYKSSERGNILLATLLISVLGTGLVLYYRFIAQNTVFKSHALKAIRAKEQALVLAHAAFEKLKLIADKDACVMYEKGKRFYFKDDPKKEGSGIPIELKLGHPGAGYRVKGIWESKLPFMCCFDQQGLRKPLDVVMQSDDGPMEKESWDLAKKRWEALKREGPLPAEFFPPLLKKVEVEKINEQGDENIHTPQITMMLHFFDPYRDRELYPKHGFLEQENEAGRLLGEIEFDVENPVRQSIHTRQQQGDPLSPANRFSPKINPKPKQYLDPDVDPITKSVSVFSNHIKHGHSYLISMPQQTLIFTIPGNLEEGFNFDATESSVPRAPKRAPHCGRWFGKASTATSVSVLNPTRKTSLKDLFPTKTWIDELNVCLFGYETGEPYNKIGNFSPHRYRSWRNHFWSETVANPEADVFYFNGPKDHIEARLKVYDIAEDQILFIANEIVKHQPYVSAVAFLEEMSKSSRIWPKLKDQLHHFECLSHRTETFKIESWCKGYNCRMVVQRNADDENKRSWRVVSVRLYKKWYRTSKNDRLKAYKPRNAHKYRR